ncbi:STAS domain-containing protein [Halobacillus litoralis]|uniref:STAS domain-containing protein n=1 Tax=Halobacillus litoralis TaxID=45668 RepID=UPI001CD20CB4|nr:STAS domain-containing protein [Halobacillus litoralis]MCA0971483.1 STAS domain-containing protein [Halobacillus litoralis]
MSSRSNLSSSDFQSLKIASQKMFHVITKQLDVNTAYVTRKDPTSMTVFSSFNKNEEIIQEGLSVEYSDTFCRLIITNKDAVLNTVNLQKDELAKKLEATSNLEVKGFLGVSLLDSNGEVFGTLCALDKTEKHFSEEDVAFMKSMSEILSYLVELDQTQYHMGFLNVPIIPITQGVSVLPLQGIIDDHRAEVILETVLKHGATHQMQHFIIDLSGLILLDHQFPPVIAQLVQSLKLMGIEAILTGMTPDMARNEVENASIRELDAKKVANLESALDIIGLRLQTN